MIREFVATWAAKKGHKPWIVDYVEDRGVWKLPDSEAINAALDSYPLDVATFDRLADKQAQHLKYEGGAILRWIAVNGVSAPVEELGVAEPLDIKIFSEE